MSRHQLWSPRFSVPPFNFSLLVPNVRIPHDSRAHFGFLLFVHGHKNKSELYKGFFLFGIDLFTSLVSFSSWCVVFNLLVLKVACLGKDTWTNTVDFVVLSWCLLHWKSLTFSDTFYKETISSSLEWSMRIKYHIYCHYFSRCVSH